MTAPVTLDNVSVGYGHHIAVHGISGRFEQGSLTAIAGPNGAGKSTLLKAIAGILPTQHGHLGVAEPFAYLPQAAGLQRDFPLSVLHMVSGGFWTQTGGLKAITPEMKMRALLALEEVGLGGFAHRGLNALSAGQLQRALFARLIVQDAPLLLLDEPFNAIDESTTRHLLDIILRWHAQKRTVVCVLHDFSQIKACFPRCLLMARECVAWDASERALHPENLLKSRFFRDDWQSNLAMAGRPA